MSDAEAVECPTCGIVWFTRAMCGDCAFRLGGPDPDCGTCHGTGEAGLTKAHACPDPLPYEQAKAFVDAAAAAGGVVVSQRLRAQVRLGLAQGPS